MITKKEGVCGGDACVEGTRIPVWTLVEFRKAGAEDADLLEWVPTLTQEGLDAVWAYYNDHPIEIDSTIRDNNEA